MTPTNNGVITRLQPAHSAVRSQEREDESARCKREVSLDPTLIDESDWCVDDDSAMRMVGYALIVVTFLVFGALLWPWLGPVVRTWFQ